MSVLSNKVGTQARAGLIKDRESCREAAWLVKRGYPVGAFVSSTCVVWIDADNQRGVESIVKIKGARRTGKPLSTVLYAADLVPMIDFNRIRADLRPIFEDAEELAARLALLCLLRVPITASAARSLPEVVVSQTPDGTRWVQNCIPGKRRGDFPLVDEMLEAGIRLPSPTSMNVSGQPEIVDQQEAIAFCSEHGIPLFLADPSAKPGAYGSYPIISAGPDGVKLLRQGHFPGYLFRYLLETDIDTTLAVPANFPIYKTHCERCASGIAPEELHDEIAGLIERGGLP